MVRAVHYDEDIAISRDLIHLQANVSGGASYCVGVEGESPSSSTTNLDAPEVSAAGGVITTRDNAIDQKPRELVFVRKKDTEEEVLVPAKLTVVSKRERKRSTVTLSLSISVLV